MNATDAHKCPHQRAGSTGGAAIAQPLARGAPFIASEPGTPAAEPPALAPAPAPLTAPPPAPALGSSRGTHTSPEQLEPLGQASLSISPSQSSSNALQVSRAGEP